MEAQKDFHCTCGRVFTSWSAKTMHLRDNRAHKDRDDLESGILAFSGLSLQKSEKEEKGDALARKARGIKRKAERLQRFKAQKEIDGVKKQESDMTDASAPIPSLNTPTTADPTEKQKAKAEKQAITLERKKAATERRQKKNILRAYKNSLQKMPSSSQNDPPVPPRRSSRLAEAESSSSAARRPRGRRSTMPEMRGSMVDVPEAMDVDMGALTIGSEASEPGQGQGPMSVAEGKCPAFEEPDVKGKGRA